MSSLSGLGMYESSKGEFSYAMAFLSRGQYPHVAGGGTDIQTRVLTNIFQDSTIYFQTNFSH